VDGEERQQPSPDESPPGDASPPASDQDEGSPGDGPPEEPEQESEPPGQPEHAPTEAEEDTDTALAVLLALAAVLAALIGARAAYLGDVGSDTWHEALREDIKHGAGLVEDVRFLYQEEAPLALQVAEARIRAREAALEAARAPASAVRDALLTEAGAQHRVANALGASSKLASNPRYREGDGFDLARRLADVRAENPDLVALDPDQTQEEGNDLAQESSLLVAAAIPVGLAFLCGALSKGFPLWRRWLIPVGYGLAAAGLIAAILVEVVH
jgi:hypothetical protein